MSVKTIEISGIGPVIFQKRRNTRSIRLHIQGSKLKVTMPHVIPYVVAERFVASRKTWVLKNLAPAGMLVNGALIGKTHILKIQRMQIKKIKTRVTNDLVIVSVPSNSSLESSAVQSKITSAAERALKKQTTEQIIPRLRDLAYEHNFEINNVKVKRLRSRWGSCDLHKNIVLNSYLAQLPWPLIDYVLVHELTHTRHLNHSSDFWESVAVVLPNYKILRKQTKQHHPHIYSSP